MVEKCMETYYTFYGGLEMEERYAYYTVNNHLIEMGYEGEEITLLRVVMERKNENNPCDITDSLYWQICEYWQGNRKTFNVKYKLKGTGFQKKVWEALRTVPYGETRTYGQIAELIGNPKAVRAVGGANGRNPLWLIIPCHRIIGADGSLTGYTGGLELKKELLNIEGIR